MLEGLLGLVSVLGSTEDSLVFTSGPSRHLVVTKSVGGLGGVVLFNESVHGLKVGHSEVVLFYSTVG